MAQFHMGTLYEKGKGVPKDEKIAIEYYKKAAKQGHQEARSNLHRLLTNAIKTTKKERKKNKPV